VIETTAKVRYTVRRRGETTPIATHTHKYIEGQSQIALKPGETIHFIEAV